MARLTTMSGLNSPFENILIDHNNARPLIWSQAGGQQPALPGSHLALQRERVVSAWNSGRLRAIGSLKRIWAHHDSFDAVSSKESQGEEDGNVV